MKRIAPYAPFFLVFSIAFTLQGQGQIPTSTTDTSVYTIASYDLWQLQFEVTQPRRFSAAFDSRDNRDDLAVAITDVYGRKVGIQKPAGDIEIMILDERNYSSFTGGKSYAAYFTTGRRYFGTIDVSLKPGKYRFVISNRHSALASKQVSISFGPGSRSLIEGAHTKVETNLRYFPLIDSRFRVNAGRYIFFPVQFRTPTRITGRYSTTGGNNDINFLILDHDNFLRWQQGLYFARFQETGYLSGQQSVDQILPPGAHVLVFDNRVAVFTSKDVVALLVQAPVTP